MNCKLSIYLSNIFRIDLMGSMSSQIAVERDEQAVMLDVFRSISLYGSMGSILSMSYQINKWSYQMTLDLSIWLFI